MNIFCYNFYFPFPVSFVSQFVKVVVLIERVFSGGALATSALEETTKYQSSLNYISDHSFQIRKEGGRKEGWKEGKEGRMEGERKEGRIEGREGEKKEGWKDGWKEGREGGRRKGRKMVEEEREGEFR